MTRALLLSLVTATLQAQGWTQWGQNPRHTGAAPIIAQKPTRILGQFTYDPLADQIRADTGGELFVHYMAPLVNGSGVFMLSRGASQWVSCHTGQSPCGTARWGAMQWGITRLNSASGALEERWTAISSWTPPPDNGSGWEPVFHPALSDGFLLMSGAAGTLLKLDQNSGELVDRIRPFEEDDPSRYVSSPVTVAPDGSVYYTVMKLDPADPWNSDVLEAYLIKADAAGVISKASFASLIPDAPSQNCLTTFNADSLPWPPAPDATPPRPPCGSQRPGLNAAPAVAFDGTIYVISRAHFNSAYAYLVAVNPDLTPKWAASLRNRLNDGCNVLVPPGECRPGSRRGVDPATNGLPAARVVDQSTASPVIAPDG